MLNYIYSFNFEIIFFLFLLCLLLQRTGYTITNTFNNSAILTSTTSKIIIIIFEIFFLLLIFKSFFFNLSYYLLQYFNFYAIFITKSHLKFYFYSYINYLTLSNIYSYKLILISIHSFISLLPNFKSFIYIQLHLWQLFKIATLFVYNFITQLNYLLVNFQNYTLKINNFSLLVNFFNLPQFSSVLNYHFDSHYYNYYLFDSSFFSFYNKYIIFIFITLYYILIFIYYNVSKLNQNTFNLKYNYLFNYEYPILIGFIFLGYTLVITSNNLFIVYLGFEIQTFTILLLSGQLRQFYTIVITSLKYFFYSFLSSLFFLLSILYLYNFSFSLNYYELYLMFLYNLENSFSNYFILAGVVFLLLSFFFKLGVFPFYIWVLDIFEGFPRFITLLLLTLNKFNLYIFLLKFLLIVSYFNIYIFNLIVHILTFSSLISLLIGSLLALTQTNIHRFFGATSITHMGLLLLLIKVNLVNYNHNTLYLTYSYFILYMLLTFLFFGVLIICSGFLNNQLILKKTNSVNFNFNYIKDFTWFNLFSKKILFGLILILFNLSGFPPFSFFFIKFNLMLWLTFNFLYLDTTLLLYFSTLITASYIRLISIIWLENINIKSNLIFKYVSQILIQTRLIKYKITIFEYFILIIIYITLFYNYFIFWIN